jgi:hypothetical protein
LDVEELGVLALGFCDCLEAADEVSIVGHDVVEANELEKIAGGEHHEVGGWQNGRLYPLDGINRVKELGS